MLAEGINNSYQALASLATEEVRNTPANLKMQSNETVENLGLGAAQVIDAKLQCLVPNSSWNFSLIFSPRGVNKYVRLFTLLPTTNSPTTALNALRQ